MFNMFNQQKNFNVINEEIKTASVNHWKVTQQYTIAATKSLAEGAVYGLAVVGAISLAVIAVKNAGTEDEN